MEPRSVRPDVTRLLVGLCWLSAATMSLVFCINVSWVEDRGALWVDNQLDPLQRRIFFISMIVAALLPSMLAAVTVRRRGLAAIASRVWTWGHRVAPLVLFAPVVPLIDRESFLTRPVVALLYILAIGLSAAAIGTRCLEQGFPNALVPAGSPVAPPRARLPLVLTATACVGLFAHLAYFSLLRHYQMRTQAYDLAIFDNMMWQLAHGGGFASTPAFGPEGNHLHRHTTLGAPLLVPLYMLWPRSETLLILQAAFAASTPLPIYLLARRVLGSPWIGFLLALSYALYAPTHGGTFYDFHFLTLAAPLFAWVFFLLFTEHTKALVAMTALTLLWREDTGAVLTFGGVVVWLFGVHPRRTIRFTIACAVYFALVKFVLMPLGDSHSSFSNYYADLKAPGTRGFAGIIETALTNPTYVFGELVERGRLIYLLQLFVPLLFYPLRDRIAWIALVPAAGFTLLASRSPLYEIYFQYVAYWAPAGFLGLVVALHRRFAIVGRSKAIWANVAAVLLATFLASFLFGSIFHSPTMRGGFSKLHYEWTEKDARRLSAFRELAAQVPADASVALTGNEVPHMSNRRDAYSLGEGHFDADYLLVRDTALRGKSTHANHFRTAIRSGRYKRIGKSRPFSLWQRSDQPEGSSTGAAPP